MSGGKILFIFIIMKEIRSLVREVLSESFLNENDENLNNATEEEQLATVKKDGDAIQYIDNPSEAVQMVAVKQDGFAIRVRHTKVDRLFNGR